MTVHNYTFTLRCSLVGCMYCPRVTQSTPDSRKSDTQNETTLNLNINLTNTTPMVNKSLSLFLPPLLPPSLPSSLPPALSLTFQGLQDLFIRLATPEHNGALGNQIWSDLLSVL